MRYEKENLHATISAQESDTMGLQSALFSADRALQACLIDDRSHVTTGAVGEHVTKIHSALVVLDNAPIDVTELRQSRYGPSTAAAVLAFKRQRHIINYSYQTKADNIVGKMTIAMMDREISIIEGHWSREVQPTPATA
jgi:hypothetical protein